MQTNMIFKIIMILANFYLYNMLSFIIVILIPSHIIKKLENNNTEVSFQYLIYEF